MSVPVRRSFGPLDWETVLHQGGWVSHSGPITDVGGVDGNVNHSIWVGEGAVDGSVWINIDGIEVGNGDERYDLVLQGCNAADFSGPVVNLAMMAFGAGAVLPGGVSSTTVGSFELAFTNARNGVGYAWLRLYADVFGTVASGLNFRAHIVPKPITNIF